jgi:hypothetical protein
MPTINTVTLELKAFFSTKVPEYAILSHRWEDGEVSLQDFIAIRRLDDPANKPYAQFLTFSLGASKDSSGYGKIFNCCEVAAADGYEWVWIDTCCI